MSRKVFISVLGTGFYGECSYSLCGKVSQKTRFVQEAMLELYKVREEWGKDDAVYILLTEGDKGARKSNWDIPSGKRHNKNSGQDENYSGLKDLIGDIRIHDTNIVHDVSIHEGKDEDELWQIFQTTYGLLNDGDELYIDLTHSFRYIPMLILVLVNYAKFLKDVNIKTITYGNFEARINDVAPVIDLLPLVKLQDWTFAAADFVQNGNITELKKLNSENLQDLLRAQNTDAQKINKLVRDINKLVDEIKLCRGLDLIEGRTYRQITGNQVLSPENHINVFQPLAPILNKIGESLSNFRAGHDVRNAFAAAEWCLENEQYQSSVTELQEGIVTFICERHGIPSNDEAKREIVNHAFFKAQKIRDNKLDEYEPFKDAAYEFKVDEIIVNDDFFKTRDLLNKFSGLTKVRNDLNHSGMRGLKNGKQTSAPQSPERLKENIKDFLIYFMNLMNCNTASKETIFSPLLINLSNHPFETWTEEQKKAAEEYGRCEDMTFPQVNPEADDSEIEEMAENAVREIEQKSKDNSVTVHVMGEMCLTFKIVRMLQDRGIRCIASTTERKVTEQPDGSRISEFHFVRFREYGE